MNEIANSNLTEKDIPPPNAGWDVIELFALSFNGYSYWGSFEKCADIANSGLDLWNEKRVLPDSLIELRTCLFFEQRRWRHYGISPGSEDLPYIHALVDAIRSKVQKGELD
jgi:hypothetical protein